MTITKTPNRFDISALAEAIDKPSLETLSYALRHPETWPAGFVWQYSNCKNCAMGLAAELWKDALSQPPPKQPEWRGRVRAAWASWASRAFAMSYEASVQIFFKTRPPFLWYKPFQARGLDAVTPAHVANAIDQYIAKQRS